MKKKSVFLKAISIYSLILIVVILIGLGVLWKYLGVFEVTRPINFANAFAGSQEISYWQEGVQQAIKNSTSPFEKRDAKPEDYGLNLTEVSKISCKPDKIGDEESVCKIYYDNHQIASLTLKPGDAYSFGFKGWKVDSIIFMPGEGKNIRATLPPDSKLYVNGVEVPESYITDKDIDFEVSVTTPFDKAPKGTLYKINDLHGPAEIVAKDSAGTELKPVETAGAESVVFSPVANKAFKFVANENAKVYINEHEITGQHAEKAKTPLTDGFESYIKDSALIYAYEGLISDPVIKVTTQGGEEIGSKTEYMGMPCYVEGSDAKAPEDKAQFADSFARAYVLFSGNVGDVSVNNWNRLNKFLLPGTVLQDKLDKTTENVAWVRGVKVVFNSVEAVEYIPMGENSFSCKVHYQITQTRSGKTTDLDESITIFVVKNDKGEWKVANMA